MKADDLAAILWKPGYSVSGSTRRESKGAKLESAIGDAALATPQVEERDNGVFRISVVSMRRRLLDEDNLAAKYHIDCTRYLGLLPSDAAGKARIQISQEKVRTEEEERTEIVIERES